MSEYEEEFYDDMDPYPGGAAEYAHEMRNDVNRPYNSDIEWGGSDKKSVLAMWMGDYCAEMYCWNKANRLGGYPWDGAPTHPSYEGGTPAPKADFSKISGKEALIAIGVCLFIAMIMCSATTW